MTDTKSPLRIDIFSDVMCPWRVIGYRQLAAALEASDVDHEIHWHPFELNPNMPPKVRISANIWPRNTEQRLNNRQPIAQS